MDGKTAINTIMELLGNINKGYFNEYEEELDTIRQKMVENEELKKENEEIKEDRKAVFDTVCELSEYIEDTENEFLEKEKIFEYIATIQNYSNN